jgi:hypothetical protein
MKLRPDIEIQDELLLVTVYGVPLRNRGHEVW